MTQDGRYGRWGYAVSDRSDGCIAVNDGGAGFGLVGANSSWLSNRWSGDAWGVARPAPSIRGDDCALANDGTALAVWEEIVGNDWVFFAASLSPADVWSDVATIQTKARFVDLSRYRTGFIALHVREAGGVYSTVYDAELGWLPAKPVTPPGVPHNYWSLSTSQEAALWTWIGAGQAQVSIYDGAMWSTQALGPVTEGTRGATGASGHLAAWNHQGAAYIARYDLEQGWGDPMKLGETTGDYVAPALAIDDAGNALAAWANQGSVVWRRRRSGDAGWSDLFGIEDQDPSYGVSSSSDASGSVMLIWQNALGIWASRFE